MSRIKHFLSKYDANFSNSHATRWINIANEIKVNRFITIYHGTCANNFLMQHGRKSSREYQILLLIALHDFLPFFFLRLMCSHVIDPATVYRASRKYSLLATREKVNNIPNYVRTIKRLNNILSLYCCATLNHVLFPCNFNASKIA